MFTTLTTLATSTAAVPAPPVDDFGLPQVVALILLPVLAIGGALWGGLVVARDAPEA